MCDMNGEHTNTSSGAVICFCNSNLAWGGGEKWHLEASLRMAARGHRVILACSSQGPLWQAAQEALQIALAEAPENDSSLAERFSLADWCFRNLSFLNPFKKSAFSRFLADQSVTHLILNLPSDLKFVAPVAARGNFPQGPIKVYYRRGSAIPVRASGHNRSLYGQLTGIIANSRETAECVRQAEIIDPRRIRVIYNGLNVAEFDKSFQAGVSERSSAPDAAFCAERPLIIGNAGRLSQQKAQKYLLYMSAELRRRKFTHKLVIAGEGELRGELESLAASLGLSCVHGAEGFQPESFCRPEDWTNFYRQPGDVFFSGFLKDLSPFWRCIDLFALSSVWEGFGYALAEAMLAEKPLLAFDMNSMPELVRSGLNGILLPPPDPDESDASVGVRLARQVIAFAGSRADMARMGRAGREFCLENFDQRVSLSRLEELLFTEMELPELETPEQDVAPESPAQDTLDRHVKQPAPVERVVAEPEDSAAEAMNEPIAASPSLIEDAPDIPDLEPASPDEAVVHPLLLAERDADSSDASDASAAGRRQEMVMNVRKSADPDTGRRNVKNARGRSR